MNVSVRPEVLGCFAPTHVAKIIATRLYDTEIVFESMLYHGLCDASRGGFEAEYANWTLCLSVPVPGSAPFV